MFKFFFFLSQFSFSSWKKETEKDDQYPPMSATPTIPFGYYHYSTNYYSPAYESSSPFAEEKVFSQRDDNSEVENDFGEPKEQEYYLFTIEPQVTPTPPPTKDDEL